MRLLHIVATIDPRAGGVSEAIRALLQYGPSNYEHEIACMDDPEASFLADLPCPTHAFGPVTSVFAYTPRLMPWLRSNRTRFNGVFVHGLWDFCGVAAWRACAGKIPYAVFTHGMLDPYFKRAFPLKHLKKWLFWLPAQYWILRDAYKVLFTCKAEAELAKESFWLHRWNPFLVSLGAVGISSSDAALQRSTFLKAFPKLKGCRFLLFLGRIHPKKGCDLLLEAFARVAATDLDLHLVMAGPDQQNWQATLNESPTAQGLTGRVHWTGMLQGDTKWGAFLASEAFVLPSHQENFGVAVAEALACGRPVLLSDKVNIAPDIAADGAGLMEADTAAGTLALLTGWIGMPPEARVTMSQQALATFAARYDMRKNAQSIVRVFEPLSDTLKEPDGTPSRL